MRWALERLTEPAVEVVSKAELKLHLRTLATDTTEDARFDEMIASAREWVESIGRVLVDTTYRLTLFGNNIVYRDLNTVTPARPGYCCGEWFWATQEIPLRRSPVIALSSFVSVDSAGVETAVDASTYALREGESKFPRIVALNGATWNEWLQYDLRITYRAGYADRTGSPTESASVVPARFKAAMKLHCEAFYDSGPDMQKYLDAAMLLLRNDRVELSMA